VLPALSDVADRSVLWLLIAAALAAKPGATRRAAVRGVAGIAVTCTITNLAV
jgi:undecaprenyl-diphosphatase